jgi:hypothetical protein
MSDEEWEKLFDLIGKVIALPMPAEEIGTLVRAKAEQFDAGADCLTFVKYFNE